MRALNPESCKWSRVLSYGELHAQVIATLKKAPTRAACLVLGMLMEGLLCGCADQIKTDLVKVGKAVHPDISQFVSTTSGTEALDAYAKFADSSMSGIELAVPGQFNVSTMRDYLVRNSPITPLPVYFDKQVDAALRRVARPGVEVAWLSLRTLVR